MMKKRFNLGRRSLAPLGLYLALLAALVSIGLYIVRKAFDLPLQISLGLVLVGLALFAILDPERVRVALTGRQARYGSNALVMSLAFLGVLSVVNYLFYKTPKRWDLTENQQYTLAPETIETLESLPQPVEALAFYTRRLPTAQAQGLLDQYKFHSGGKFDFVFIDPEQDIAAARQANIQRDGTIVLKMGDNQEIVTYVQEREITGALVRLISPGKMGVYFLVGHGEYSPEDSGEGGYAQARITLEKKNYEVKTLNLLAEKKIPEDATVIVIAGADEIPLSEGEVEQLKTFLGNGGGLIVLMEPPVLTKYHDVSDPLAGYLTQSWGVTLKNDLVVDLTPDLFGNVRLFDAYAAEYGDHAITDKMSRVVTVYPTARSVGSGSAGGIIPTALVLTAKQSWAETDLAFLSKTKEELTNEPPAIQPDDAMDTLGPVPLAVAASDITTKGRVVVFGDSDFATDSNFEQVGNGDMFINAVDWAAEQENLINLTPKDAVQRVVVSPKGYAMNLIFLGVVIVMPGAVLVAGVITWFQRRRRG
jgi:ABC-type uncharacterized transport system involved in gliding motility auxiliary subunit